MTVANRSTSQKSNRATTGLRPIKFKIIPAPEKLKEEVECFRIAEYTGEEGLAIKVSLNGSPGIVFQHHQGRSPVENITTPSRCNSDIPTLYIYGQQTEPAVMNHKGPYTLTQVILKPHAPKNTPWHKRCGIDQQVGGTPFLKGFQLYTFL
jgi:hypothetical protein